LLKQAPTAMILYCICQEQSRRIDRNFYYYI
jgi:hypothetical protein